MIRCKTTVPKLFTPRRVDSPHPNELVNLRLEGKIRRAKPSDTIPALVELAANINIPSRTKDSVWRDSR